MAWLELMLSTGVNISQFVYFFISFHHSCSFLLQKSVFVTCIFAIFMLLKLEINQITQHTHEYPFLHKNMR